MANFITTLFTRIFAVMFKSLDTQLSKIEQLAYWQEKSNTIAEWLKSDTATTRAKNCASSFHKATLDHFAECTGDVRAALEGEMGSGNIGTVVIEERQAFAHTAKGYFLALCSGALFRDIMSEEKTRKGKTPKNPFCAENGDSFKLDLTGENGKGEANLQVAYNDNGGKIIALFRSLYAVLTLTNGDETETALDGSLQVNDVKAEKRKVARATLQSLEIVPDCLLDQDEESSIIPTLELLDYAYAGVRVRAMIKDLQTAIQKAQQNEKATTLDKLEILCNADELKDYEEARAKYFALRKEMEALRKVENSETKRDELMAEANEYLSKTKEKVSSYCQRSYTDGKRTVKPFQSIAINWRAEFEKAHNIEKSLKVGA